MDRSLLKRKRNVPLKKVIPKQNMAADRSYEVFTQDLFRSGSGSSSKASKFDGKKTADSGNWFFFLIF
jgi:hypothetical protein